MAQPQPRSSKGKYIAIGVGIGVAAIIAVIALASTGVSSLNSITAKEHKENIVNGIIGVEAASYQYYTFSAPNDASDVKIEGRFTASGGGGNDIKVLILDQTAFTNWRNGHQVDAYYVSGKLTTENISVELPAGETLYLVYDNTFSFLSDKNVETRVDLVYTA